MIAGPPQADTLALAELTQRIGSELDCLMRLSLTVQAALSRCTCTHPRDSETLKSLQGIDRITQGLADIARLMTDISDAAPEGIHLARHSLERRLQLRGLCQRIFVSDTRLVQPEASSSSGEVLLF